MKIEVTSVTLDVELGERRGAVPLISAVIDAPGEMVVIDGSDVDVVTSPPGEIVVIDNGISEVEVVLGAPGESVVIDDKSSDVDIVFDSEEVTADVTSVMIALAIEIALAITALVVVTGTILAGSTLIVRSKVNPEPVSIVDLSES